MKIEITGLVYLDHAGATLYSELQMESVFNDLTSNVYGNPRILISLKNMSLLALFRVFYCHFPFLLIIAKMSPGVDNSTMFPVFISLRPV